VDGQFLRSAPFGVGIVTTETQQVSEQTVVVRYVKSCIGYFERQKRTLRALGLKRLGDQVELPATDSVQGMLRKIGHLVEVTDVATRSVEEGA
jgi:large subunit ribosomal protein L30